MMVAGWWLICLLGYGGDSLAMGAASHEPAIFSWLWLSERAADLTALTLIALFFGWQARRRVLGQSWLLLACVLLSLQGLCFTATLRPHWFSIHFVSPTAPGDLDWIKAAMPLAVAGLAWVRGRNQQIQPTS